MLSIIILIESITVNQAFQIVRHSPAMSGKFTSQQLAFGKDRNLIDRFHGVSQPLWRLIPDAITTSTLLLHPDHT